MNDQKEIITKNAEETRELGKEFAKKLNAGDVVALYGDLGAGKTYFVQGLAEGLGITRRITSPTFVIMRTYEISNRKQVTSNKKNPGVILVNEVHPESGQKDPRQAPLQRDPDMIGAMTRKNEHINFYHVDLYRINEPKEVQNLGLLDIIKEGKSIVAIEWAEKMEKLLPKNTIRISFQDSEESKRKITFVTYDK